MEFISLRAARKAAGLTQDDLAKKIGVNRATLSKYESGAISPDLNQLCIIAAALGISPSSLLDGPDWSDSVDTKKKIADHAARLSEIGDSETASILLEQGEEILGGDVADDLQIEKRINTALSLLSHEGHLLAMEQIEAISKCDSLRKK